MLAPSLKPVARALPPQAAGVSYPKDAGELSRELARCLVSARPHGISAPKVIIAPHGPLSVSGAVAASAYAGLANRSDMIRRVVVLAPAQRMAFRGIATPMSAGLSTPLGAIALDDLTLRRLRPFATVTVDDRPFENEQSLEVQLPFLQACLSEFQLIPIIVGNVYPDVVARVLEAVWGGPETLIVISSNLSVEPSEDRARVASAETRGLIETLAHDQVNTARATGHRIIAGALLRAQAIDLRVTGVDMHVAPAPAQTGRMASYGAFVMENAATAALSSGRRATILAVAAQALACEVGGAGAAHAPSLVSRQPASLSAMRACKIALTRDGQLRGVSGGVLPTRQLLVDVAMRAAEAGRGAPGFPPVTADELDSLTLSVSILSHARPMPAISDEGVAAALTPGRDGLVIEDRGRSAIFLPAMWDRIADPQLFVAALKQKVGLSAGFWPQTVLVRRLSAETFSAPVGALLGGR